MFSDQQKKKRALSNDEFYSSGIDPYEYSFCKQEGVHIATLDAKRWGKKCNILGYFTTESGMKIITSAWNHGLSPIPYLGMDRIPIGSKVKLTFKMSEYSEPYLRAIEVIE